MVTVQAFGPDTFPSAKLVNTTKSLVFPLVFKFCLEDLMGSNMSCSTAGTVRTRESHCFAQLTGRQKKSGAFITFHHIHSLVSR